MTHVLISIYKKAFVSQSKKLQITCLMIFVVVLHQLCMGNLVYHSLPFNQKVLHTFYTMAYNCP